MQLPGMLPGWMGPRPGWIGSKPVLVVGPCGVREVEVYVDGVLRVRPESSIRYESEASLKRGGRCAGSTFREEQRIREEEGVAAARERLFWVVADADELAKLIEVAEGLGKEVPESARRRLERLQGAGEKRCRKGRVAVVEAIEEGVVGEEAAELADVAEAEGEVEVIEAEAGESEAPSEVELVREVAMRRRVEQVMEADVIFRRQSVNQQIDHLLQVTWERARSKKELVDA